MANTLKFGAGQWATKEGSTLAYNDENDNFKPLPFDFTRASNATVVNKAGLIETVGNGIPRIDYKDDSKGALLLEPSRSNAITNSEEFGSIGWSFVTTGSAIAPIVSDNYAISPDGTQNAQRIQFDLGGGTTTSDRTIIRQNVGAQSDWFLSVWMKSTNGTEQKILWHTTADSNETVVTGEWQRFTFSRNGISNSWAGLGLRGSVSDVDTADILVYGFQAEQGSYATSYIPTQGSSVTRLADSCSQTPPSGVIGQTEGVVFMDFIAQNATGQSQSHFWLGASGNEIGLYGGGQFIFYSSGGVSINGGNIVTGQRYKVAFGYKANDYVAYVNGNQVGTDTSATVPTMSGLALNSYFNGTEVQKKNITDFKLYNTRLSNTELQALTQV